MRIGLDYTAAVQQSAGIGRYCRELVGALAALDCENEYVLLVAGRPGATALQRARERFSAHPNFVLRPVPLSERWLNRLWHRLRLPLYVEAFTGPLDLFHSTDFTLPPVRRARTLLQVHDLSFLRTPQYAEPSLQRYLRQVVPRSVRRADLVLADSQHTKSDIVALLGIPPERVMVVLAGVESRFQRVTDEDRLQQVRQRHGLNQPFILGLGTLEPRKNFAGLISAYGILRARQGIPHELVIGGRQGWLYQGIFDRVAELGLQQQVRFLGFVADEDLPALYTLADVFAFPSFYEGFGIPILESMACGTPVVASNASSLPEVVGEAGLMVSPENTEALVQALGQALQDTPLRHTLISRGREQARRFTWERAAQQLLLAYRYV